MNEVKKLDNLMDNPQVIIDYQKYCDVADSCMTEEQMQAADKMYELFLIKYNLQ